MKKRFVVLCSAGLLLAGCGDQGVNPYQPRSTVMSSEIDSTHHVICYSYATYGGHSIACVALDSLNQAAR